MKITSKYLTKVYPNGTYALDGFSAVFESGEITAVLGPSGCGKTTLLRLLAGLEKPTAGELYFDGVLFSDIPLKRRDTAVVFQEYILYPKMTVWENVATALARYELPREEEERRVKRALTELGLIKFRNQLPRVLSGGQQQRVALARAIVREPSLILFDEPLSNVAPEQRQEYIRLIKQTKEKLPRATFVYVTHNPQEAMLLGDRLLIMDEGCVLQYGDKQRVRKNPCCADVLRCICADCKELSGSVKSGIFTGQSGEKVPFEGAEDMREATVIFNPYDNNVPCLFDGEGNAVYGLKNVLNEPRTTYFDGTFDGETLEFCGAEYAVDEDFKKRFIGSLGHIRVGIESVRLRTRAAFGDIKIPAERCGEQFKIGNRLYYIFGAEDFDGAFYVDPADINLYSGERRVLAHYRVYKSKCAAKAAKGKLRMPCGALNYGGKSRGNVSVSFGKNAFAATVKKGGLKATCLAEEDLGDVRLVYCILKGFDNYVAFFAKPKDRFFAVKKLRVSVSENDIKLVTDFRLARNR